VKFKKYYNNLVSICIVLIVIIFLILFKSDLAVTRGKKSSVTEKSGSSIFNMALIINEDCSDAKVTQICNALESISKDFKKTYTTFNVNNYNNSYEDTITAATVNGASLIICPDSSFEEVVYKLQTSYVNVYFLILDGIPHNSDYSDSTLNYNVIPLVYDEAEIGFFAGYAVAYEGYKNVSFVGLNDSKSSRYFYGFLYGINYASQSLNINDVTVNYGYTTVETCDIMLGKMCDKGSEIFLVSGNDIIQNTIDICTERQKHCIICSDNYSPDSDCIIASSHMNITSTLYNCIYNIYTNNITGGNIIKCSASNESIGLLFDNEDFENFNSDIYNTIYQELAEDKIIVISDTTISPDDLELDSIKSITQVKDDNVS
jgi:basic membrane protein A